MDMLITCVGKIHQ